MREFPTNETTSIRLRATVCPIFSASGFIKLKQLPFAVVFMLTDSSTGLFSWVAYLQKHLLFFHVVLYIILPLKTFRRRYILIVRKWQQTETNYYSSSYWIVNLKSINGSISKMLNKFLLKDAFIYFLIYVRFTLFEITKGKVYTVYSAFLCLLHYAFCYQFISVNTVNSALQSTPFGTLKSRRPYRNDIDIKFG